MKTGKRVVRHGHWVVFVWSGLVVATLVVMVIGLERSLLWVSTPQLRQEARVGFLFIGAGTVLSLAAADLSRRCRMPLWISVLVAAPAVLIGGTALAASNSLFPHIAALLALPAALLGLIAGLLRSPVHGGAASSPS